MLDRPLTTEEARARDYESALDRILRLDAAGLRRLLRKRERPMDGWTIALEQRLAWLEQRERVR